MTATSTPPATSVDVIEAGVFARIDGEPLTKLPHDLYIPPDALEVILERFEGPLDLLLYLIRKQNFDILDIPLAEVTRQYLRYIDEIRRFKLELAAEYLLMAALLIDIKARMLLPVRRADSDEAVADPRAELARRLLEYEQMKTGARLIDNLPQRGRDFLTAHATHDTATPSKLPDVSATDLHKVWTDLLRRAKLVQHHRISREALSVRDTMTRVLRTLQQRRFAEFQEMFDPSAGTPMLVVTFVALLELAKETLIEITQAAAYAPIYVRLAYQPSVHV